MIQIKYFIVGNELLLDDFHSVKLASPFAFHHHNFAERTAANNSNWFEVVHAIRALDLCAEEDHRCSILPFLNDNTTARTYCCVALDRR